MSGSIFKGSKALGLFVIAIVLIASVAAANAGSVPYTFTSGTTAKASEVNANFQYLADRSWELGGADLWYSGGVWVYGSFSAASIISNGSILPLSSQADVEITIDSNNNPSVFSFFEIFNGAGNNIFYVAEDGSVWAKGSITQGSSRTLKEGIATLSYQEANEALMGMDAVKYFYKTDSTKDQHVGFIAEDVPALVATNDRKGISPMDVVAVLTRVVQEQQKTIDALSGRITELEGRIK